MDNDTYFWFDADESTDILTIINREMSQLKHSPISCIKVTDKMDLMLETHST